VTASPRPAPCWAEVDLAALRGNLRLLRAAAAGAPMMAVVKADAYGHGAVPVARALAGAGVESLGVATVEEGRELRAAGIAAPVLMMGRCLPQEYPEALRWGLALALPDPALAPALSALAVRLGVTAAVHLKVDTGMNRLGVGWEQAAEAARAVSSLPGISLAGVFSHLACADEEDGSFTALQCDRFARVAKEAAALGVAAPFHLANSAAVLSGALRQSPFDPASGGARGRQGPDAREMGVRPGLALYGCAPSPRPVPGLVPVLSWKCRVIQVRESPAGAPVSYARAFTTRRPSRLAVIALGYADGFPRALGNRARLLVRERRAPVAGRVCMDLTVLDVTDIPGVERGDEVAVIGAQGDERITAGELADLAETIPYEILTRISQRVPRLYRDDGPAGPAEGGAP
jgi:alanine racemase